MHELTLTPTENGRLRIVEFEGLLAQIQRGESIAVYITEPGYIDQFAESVKQLSVNRSGGRAVDTVEIVSSTAALVIRRV